MAKKVYDSYGVINLLEKKVFVTIHLTDIGSDEYLLNEFYNISTNETKCIVGILKRESSNPASLEFLTPNKPMSFEFYLNRIQNYKNSHPLNIVLGSKVRFIVLHDEGFKKCKLECFKKFLDLPKHRYNWGIRVLDHIKSNEKNCFSDCQDDDGKSKFDFLVPSPPETSGDSILVGIK